MPLPKFLKRFKKQKEKHHMELCYYDPDCPDNTFEPFVPFVQTGSDSTTGDYTFGADVCPYCKGPLSSGRSDHNFTITFDPPSKNGK